MLNRQQLRPHVPSEGENQMDRFEAFTGSILELNRHLQKLKEIEMRPYGLRAGHVNCLYYLGKNPQGLTATELTEACREDKAAVSRSLAQLIEKGLVRGNFPEHKRAYRTKLYLTEAGQQLVRTFDQRIDAALTSGGIGLTQQQKENLYSTMDTIINNLSVYISEKEHAE